MKKILYKLFVLFLLNVFIYNHNCIAQVYQQQNVNINLPTIEKTVYVDRYRTIYVEKPRVARKLSEPIQLLGYLWVYPEDIGNYSTHPTSVIANINSQSPYGRNDWRVPTPDELAVLEANADVIGLGDDIYMATTHRNGVLRLVSTGKENSSDLSYYENSFHYREVGVLNGTQWLLWDEGNNSERVDEWGIKFKKDEVDFYFIPPGWRLPTYWEVKQLIAAKCGVGEGKYGWVKVVCGATFKGCGRWKWEYIIIPKDYYYATDHNGKIQLYEIYDNDIEISSKSSGYIRLVKE